jgi:hypothetical protein
MLILNITILYSKVYGVHVNKTSGTGTNVLASIWLTGQGNTSGTVHTMPLFIATANG